MLVERGEERLGGGIGSAKDLSTPIFEIKIQG
jgi:hypothetical protein